jgi:hypothetical protein
MMLRRITLPPCVEDVFDWLVDIIRIHCQGGTEEEDGVRLVLD